MSWNAPRSRRPARTGPSGCTPPTPARLVSKAGSGSSAARVAFSPDGDRLAAGGSDGAVRLWEVPAQGTGVELGWHDGEINALSFSADGRHLATASGDGTVGLWDVRAHAALGKLRGHAAAVTAPPSPADAAPGSSRRAATGQWGSGMPPPDSCWRARIRSWVPCSASRFRETVRTFRGARAARRRGARRRADALAGGSTPGPPALCGSGVLARRQAAHRLGARRFLRAWNVTSGSQSYELPAGAPFFTGASVASHPTGARWRPDPAAAPSGCGTRRPASSSRLPATRPRSPRSRSARTGSSSPPGRSTARCWSGARKRGTSGRGSTGTSPRWRGSGFARDGRALASAGADHKVRLWDLTHGGTPITIDAGFPVAALAVSVDGKALATAGEDQPIPRLGPEHGQASSRAGREVAKRAGPRVLSRRRTARRRLQERHGRPVDCGRSQAGPLARPPGPRLVGGLLARRSDHRHGQPGRHGPPVGHRDPPARRDAASLPSRTASPSRGTASCSPRWGRPAVQLLELADRRKLRPAGPTWKSYRRSTDFASSGSRLSS